MYMYIDNEAVNSLFLHPDMLNVSCNLCYSLFHLHILDLGSSRRKIVLYLAWASSRYCYYGRFCTLCECIFGFYRATTFPRANFVCLSIILPILVIFPSIYPRMPYREAERSKRPSCLSLRGQKGATVPFLK